jgi:hypothetical protein
MEIRGAEVGGEGAGFLGPTPQTPTARVQTRRAQRLHHGDDRPAASEDAGFWPVMRPPAALPSVDLDWLGRLLNWLTRPLAAERETVGVTRG